MAERRYAQGTTVPIAKTRVDLEAVLRKHGADQIMSGSDSAARIGFVGFTLRKRQYRIQLPARSIRGVKPDQLEREQWRALLLIIKAKLEFIRDGFTEPEQEFMAHVVLPNGATVGEELAPRLAEAYATGNMPRLLPGGRDG